MLDKTKKERKTEKIFETKSNDLNVKGNICEAFVEYMSEEKQKQKKNDSIFDGYLKTILKEKVNLKIINLLNRCFIKISENLI